jgi:CheY-like chemotaxis protein
MTDFKLPYMTGVELDHRRKELQPDGEALLITGYASAETERQATETGLPQVLSKPVKVAVEMEMADGREMSATLSESGASALLALYSGNVELARQPNQWYRLKLEVDESWQFPLIRGELLFALIYISPDFTDRIRKDFPSFSKYIRDRKSPSATS